MFHIRFMLYTSSLHIRCLDVLFMSINLYSYNAFKPALNPNKTSTFDFILSEVRLYQPSCNRSKDDLQYPACHDSADGLFYESYVSLVIYGSFDQLKLI